MTLTIYRVFYFSFWIFSFFLIPFSSKLRIGLRGRKGLISRLKRSKEAWVAAGLAKEPFWFHFASAGELEQAIPIAEELKKRDPKASVLFTYFSPSGEKAVQLELTRRQQGLRPPPWDGADYLPLDLPWAVSEALNSIHPRALILINRELWPELLTQCPKKSIPTFLFSAFFSDSKTKMLTVWRPYLQNLKCIGTVGEASAQLLKNQVQATKPLPQILSLGDTRVERVLERKNLQVTSPPWGDFLTHRPLMVAASVWKEDFKALGPLIEQIASSFPQWRFVLVPHEPNLKLVTQIKLWGKDRGVPFRWFSHFLENPDILSPLIVDRVGFLAELYRFSSLAFVGGSFRSRVHNVLEPAAYGNAIVTGPFINNSFEATEMNQLKLGLVSANSASELFTVISARLTDSALLKSEGEKAYQYLLDRQGASKKYCDLLESQLYQT